MATELVAGLFNQYAETELADAGNGEFVKAAYSKLLGLPDDFDGSGARIGYWVKQLAKGELSRDDFAETFLTQLSEQGDLSDDDFALNQQLDQSLDGLADVDDLEEVEAAVSAVVSEFEEDDSEEDESEEDDSEEDDSEEDESEEDDSEEDDSEEDDSEEDDSEEDDSEEDDSEEDESEENEAEDALGEDNIETLAALFDEYAASELDGNSPSQLVKAAYEYFLGLTDDFEGSGERLGFWVSQIANGRLQRDDFAETFIERAFTGGGALTEEQAVDNQAVLSGLTEDMPESVEALRIGSSQGRASRDDAPGNSGNAASNGNANGNAGSNGNANGKGRQTVSEEIELTGVNNFDVTVDFVV